MSFIVPDGTPWEENCKSGVTQVCPASVVLGALRSDVIAMVMREVFILIGVGLAVGLALALTLAYLIQGQHYGLKARDPLTSVGSAIVAKSLMDAPSLTSSNLRLLRFRTGAENRTAQTLAPLMLQIRRPSSLFTSFSTYCHGVFILGAA